MPPDKPSRSKVGRRPAEPEPPGRSVERAWQAFAGGDLGAAIRHARQAYERSSGQTPAPPNSPEPAAAAALGYFLLESGALQDAADVLLPACQQHAMHAPLHWYAGYLYQRLGRHDLAVHSLRRACELDDSLDEAAFALAWALHEQGDLAEAFHWASKALQSAPRPQRLLQVAWLHQRLDRFAQAAQAYREAIEGLGRDAPEQPRAQLQLAQCLCQLGQHAQARVALRHALDLSDGAPQLRVDAAWCFRSMGDAAQALTLAQSVTREQADDAGAGAWYAQGVLQQEAGDLHGAERSLAQAQAHDGSLVDAMLRRAQILRGWGRFEEALCLMEQVCQQAPQWPAAQQPVVQLLLDLRRTEVARRKLVALLRARPEQSDLWRLLAVAQVQRGRPRMALRFLRRALRLHAGNIEALRMQGWLALELPDLPTALDAVQRLLACLAHDVAAQVQAAFVLAQAGQLAQASAWAQRAVAAAPHDADAWRALSQVRLSQRRFDEAGSAIAQALRIAPDRVEGWRHLGWVHMGEGRFAMAQQAFSQALERAPDDPVVWLELAQAHGRGGDERAALAALDAALARRPGWDAALLARAQLLAEHAQQLPQAHAQAVVLCAKLIRGERLRVPATRVLLRLAGLGAAHANQALRLVPLAVLRAGYREAIVEAMRLHGPGSFKRLTDAAAQCLAEDSWVAAASLYMSSLSAGVSATDLVLQARTWYRALKVRSGLSKFGPLGHPDPQDRRVRIGYIAGQLHDSLLRRVLAAHSPQQAVVFVYTNQAYPGLPAHILVEPLQPQNLAQSCAANRLDVVIDAGGLHPFEGQFELLQAYARRLAPVQLGWLGCWGSSGGLFDGLLTDRWAVPVQQGCHYEEAVHCLEGGQWCWDPPLLSAQLAPSPVCAQGFITFGVSARSLRLNAQCLDAFCQVVAAVPRSVIRFIGEIANDWPLRAEILARMQAHGVPVDRVLFDSPRPYAQFLDWFAQVDLVLDSFPGNGGLSLLDALWMGVPAITCAGEWAGARQGCSVLTALGLEAWIATGPLQFCEIAVRVAGDRAGLAQQREALRPRMLASGLTDGRRIAAQIEQLCARLAHETNASDAAADPKEQFRKRAQRDLEAWMAVPRAMDMPRLAGPETPDLTVVVVLFNQAGLSRRTLQSLADQRGASFELIVVDNASSDRTAQLLRCVQGARVIYNEENLGFLLAVNQAAQQARGQYLVLLNSDAILQDGALARALECMRADPDIGALGGRVVLCDGGLQEAGNGVFCDGSAGGIGRGEDAFGHAARVRRSTDYVSGVFLATPLALWRSLGGFDLTFAPAYYEDTDYCLRVWAAGFTVVYEPSVLVEHLEWGSAAGGEATRQMRHNRALFQAKHAQWLQHAPRPMALSLDADMWRSPQDRPRRPRVLMLDNEVPHMDRGGGLPRARLMLQALSDWPVTLYPLWNADDEWQAVYRSIPETVEVALGHGFAGLEAFLERRRGVYDVLMVSRPPNLRAIQALRERRPELFDGMRLVYDAEALFALREIGQAAVKGRPLTRLERRSKVSTEIALASDADAVMVVSQRDARYFKAAGHRVFLAGHGIGVRQSAPGLTERGGLLFVGALHPDTPNEDGLLWFVREVMPRLCQSLAQAPVLSVVGLCMSEKVASLAGPQVRLLGPQDALEPHYDAARVFVAPARYAAGVPAKVIEAAAHGLPVAASTLLVRQLGWRQGLEIQAGTDAECFAQAVARLLQDDALWLRQQSAAWSQCTQRYAPLMFAQTLRDALSNPHLSDPVQG